MKLIYLCLILIIGIYGLTSNIVPMVYINYYTLIVLIPVITIIVKKNLTKVLFIWILLLVFQGVPWIKLQGLPDISPYRVIWLMMVFIILFELVVRQRKKIGGITGIKTAMILFSIYTLLSMVPTGLIIREGQGNFLMNYVIPFSTFFVARALITTEKDIKNVFVFFSILGFYIGFTGICEYLKLDFLIFPSYIADPKRGAHFGMARGPFLETSQNGVVAGMLLFVVIHTLMQSRNTLSKIFFGSTLPFIISGFIFTFNRASWLGASFASLILPIFYPQLRKYFLILFLLIIFAIGAFQTGMFELPKKKNIASTKTFAGRILQYEAAWNMFVDKPVLGYGYNNHMKHVRNYFDKMRGVSFDQLEHSTIHNVLLNMLLQIGLIGTGLYLYMMYCILAISVRLYKLLPNDGFAGKSLVISYWGICSTFFMKYMFTEWKTEMFPIVFFFMISGIVVGLYQRTISNAKTESSSMNEDNLINVPV